MISEHHEGQVGRRLKREPPAREPRRLCGFPSKFNCAIGQSGKVRCIIQIQVPVISRVQQVLLKTVRQGCQLGHDFAESFARSPFELSAGETKIAQRIVHHPALCR